MTDRPKRVRQTDVARVAGVSQATVSLVLSNSMEASIGAKAREAVVVAARELGYAPDPIAQKLARGRSLLLGLHTFAPEFPTSLSDSYYPYLEGVEQEASAQGYDLVLFTGVHRDGRGESHIQRLRLAEGIVLVGRNPRMEDVRALLRDGQTVVYIGRHDEFGPEVPYVGADYAAATACLVDRLHALGHQSIIYLQEKDEAAASVDRELGFFRAPRREGQQRTALRLIPSEVTPGRIAEWMRSGYTAVLVEGTDTTDLLAATTLAIHASGLEFPRDISVAVTGGELQVFGRAFSGFSAPRREMGRQAARLLVAILSGDQPTDSDLRQLLACTQIDGETVRAM